MNLTKSQVKSLDLAEIAEYLSRHPPEVYTEADEAEGAIARYILEGILMRHRRNIPGED